MASRCIAPEGSCEFSDVGHHCRKGPGHADHHSCDCYPDWGNRKVVEEMARMLYVAHFGFSPERSIEAACKPLDSHWQMMALKAIVWITDYQENGQP